MTLSRFLPAAHFTSLYSLSRRMPRWVTSVARGSRWIVLALVLVGLPHLGNAQIQVDVAQGATYGAHCSLQEAIYATEFGTNAALDATDPDSAYASGCSDASGQWNTIDLPGGTLQFTQSWGGDGHNPFGPTATPIIFNAITIRGHGTTLQWAGTGYSRLFAVGYASISFPPGVANGTGLTGTYSGTGNLTLQDVWVKAFQVKGGDGICGGGGGLGAGGAIYVGKNSSGVPVLTVENSTFDSNGATGGNGSYYGDAACQETSTAPGGGGGGGLYGSGAPPGQTTLGGGGGGGGGTRGNGGAGDSVGGAGGGGGGTVFSGGVSSTGGPGGLYCGGNGGDVVSNGHD